MRSWHSCELFIHIIQGFFTDAGLVKHYDTIIALVAVK